MSSTCTSPDCHVEADAPLRLKGAVGIAGSALGAGVAGLMTGSGGEGGRRIGISDGPEAFLKNVGAAWKSCS